MALSLNERAQYISIIDTILGQSDLETISEKRIRKGIQDRVGIDITPQKAAIKALILERFDIFNAQQNGTVAPQEPISVHTADPVPSIEPAEPTQLNGHSSEQSRTATPAKREAASDESSDIVYDAPPKKKRKPSVDDDAMLAARLQAEEDKRARPTRNGVSRKASSVKKKRTPKKKTASKVTGSDDSDVNDEGSGRKVNRETGFHKPLNLSSSLSALFGGETSMSRPQVTKRIWQHIKGNDLQDPADKRFIICDEQMREIFKQDKVHMFTMTKLLNQHMYAIDE